MNHFNTSPQRNASLQLIPAAAMQPIRRVKTKNRSYLADVRKSLRNSAAALRHTAHAMYVLGVLVVFGFCSCNGIVREIYLAAQFALTNTMDYDGGTIAAVICCLVGFTLGCLTIFMGVILNSFADSIANDARQLSKEAKA